MAHKKDDDSAIRITTAAEPRSADITRRQKSYLLSMSIRSLCFVGAVLAGLAHINWLWPIFIAGALLLPYVAVVRANAARTKGEDLSLLDSPYGRSELRGGTLWREAEARRTARQQTAQPPAAPSADKPVDEEVHGDQ